MTSHLRRSHGYGAQMLIGKCISVQTSAARLRVAGGLMSALAVLCAAFCSWLCHANRLMMTCQKAAGGMLGV